LAYLFPEAFAALIRCVRNSRRDEMKEKREASVELSFRDLCLIKETQKMMIILHYQS
jgi:hypothetical protein